MPHNFSQNISIKQTAFEQKYDCQTSHKAGKKVPNIPRMKLF
jgi:hypothetical protein